MYDRLLSLSLSLSLPPSLLSTWLCSFALCVSIGSALLLPMSIISNEILVHYPNSYYVRWLNTSLIQGKPLVHVQMQTQSLFNLYHTTSLVPGKMLVQIEIFLKIYDVLFPSLNILTLFSICHLCKCTYKCVPSMYSALLYACTILHDCVYVQAVVTCVCLLLAVSPSHLSVTQCVFTDQLQTV